jgi:hypothetical protein
MLSSVQSQAIPPGKFKELIEQLKAEEPGRRLEIVLQVIKVSFTQQLLLAAPSQM